MRRVGAGLLAALAVAAIVVAGLAALGSARGAEADPVTKVVHRRAPASTVPTRRPPQGWQTQGGACLIAADGCGEQPCVQFVAGHAAPNRPRPLPRRVRSRCATVGGRGAFGHAVPVVAGAR